MKPIDVVTDVDIAALETYAAGKGDTFQVWLCRVATGQIRADAADRGKAWAECTKAVRARRRIDRHQAQQRLGFGDIK